MLYIYGDSFSSDISLKMMGDKNSQENWWGSRLSRDLQEKLVKRALPGCSNYDILRWITEDLHKFTENDTIIVGLTHPQRFLIPSKLIKSSNPEVLRRIQHNEWTKDVQPFEVQGYHIGAIAGDGESWVSKELFNTLWDLTYKHIQPLEDDYHKYWVHTMGNLLKHIKSTSNTKVLMWCFKLWTLYPTVKEELQGKSTDDVHWGRVGHSKFPKIVQNSIEKEIFYLTHESLNKVII